MTIKTNPHKNYLFLWWCTSNVFIFKTVIITTVVHDPVIYGWPLISRKKTQTFALPFMCTLWKKWNDLTDMTAKISQIKISVYFILLRPTMQIAFLTKAISLHYSLHFLALNKITAHLIVLKWLHFSATATFHKTRCICLKYITYDIFVSITVKTFIAPFLILLKSWK